MTNASIRRILSEPGLHLRSFKWVSSHHLLRRLRVGIFANFLTSIANQGSSLLASLLVARFLGRESFGQFAILQTTLLTFSTLAQVTLGSTVLKYVAEYRCTDPVRTGKIVRLCRRIAVGAAFLFAAVMVCFAPELAATLARPGLTTLLRIAAITMFFTSINGYQVGALSGLEAYRTLAWAGLICGSFTLLAALVGVWQFDLRGAMVGLATSAAVRCLIHARYLHRELIAKTVKTESSDLSQEWALIANFMVPATLAGYFSALMIWLANVVVIRQPGGYGQMAMYGAAMNLRACALFLPVNVVSGVCLSVLNNVRGGGNLRQYKALFRVNVAIVFLSAALVTGFLGFFGPTLMGLFGRDFNRGTTIFRFALISALPEALSVGLYQNLQAQGLMWLSVSAITIPRDLAILLGAMWLVPHLGALGLTSAYAIAWTMAAAIIFALNVLVSRGAFGLGTN